MYVNKVGPYFNPHETYHYYQLPVCRPAKVRNTCLTLMLMVNNLANPKLCKKPEKCLDGFQKSLRPRVLDKSSLSIGRVKFFMGIQVLVFKHELNNLQLISK